MGRVCGYIMKARSSIDAPRAGQLRPSNLDGMSTKPETLLIARVHRHLDKAVYREKMANPYRGGTPDSYYEGNKTVLWVEWKHYPSQPRVFDVTKQEKLTKLQQRWLKRAHGNGVCTAVMAGTPAGIIICEGLTWTVPHKPSIFYTAEETAKWIEKLTMEPMKMAWYGLASNEKNCSQYPKNY